MSNCPAGGVGIEPIFLIGAEGVLRVRGWSRSSHLEAARRGVEGQNQLGRRNLDPLQKDVLIGRRYELEKKAYGGNRRSEESSPNNADLKTAERLAIEYQVDHATVERAGAFVQGLDALATVREDLPQSKHGHDLLDISAE